MKTEDIRLPDPRYDGNISVEKAMKNRRTIRKFKPDSLTLAQLSQLAWSAQGITDKRGYRSAPSGGALYPLDVYVLVGKDGVKELTEGVYLYLPQQHALRMLAGDDRRKDIGRASLLQRWVAQAPVVFTITAEYQRITVKYGDEGIRYALMEAGNVSQNIFLQAEALGLGAGIVGAFHVQSVADVISALPGHEPLLIMPVGYRK